MYKYTFRCKHVTTIYYIYISDLSFNIDMLIAQDIERSKIFFGRTQDSGDSGRTVSLT